MFIYPSPDRHNSRNLSVKSYQKARFFLVLLKVEKDVYFLHAGFRSTHGKTGISKLVLVDLGVKVSCSFFLEITEKECACALLGGAIASQRL